MNSRAFLFVRIGDGASAEAHPARRRVFLRAAFGVHCNDWRPSAMKREEYRDEWARLSPLLARMVRKDGRCKHACGDTFCFRNPYEKPTGICMALWHVLESYAWRAALGFPSWEADDQTVYRLHCPSSSGTVWEMRKASAGEYESFAAGGSAGQGAVS